MVNVIDKTAPKFLSLTPNTGSSAIPLNQDLTLTFNENIQTGTGKITLNNGSSSVVLQSNEIKVNSKTVIINPVEDLLSNSHYTLKIANGAINDSAGNNYTGKTFSFDTVDTLAPTLKATLPSNGQKLVSLNRDIKLVFNEKIHVGTGDIILSNGVDIRTIPVTDKQITINGNKLVFNQTKDFDSYSTYNVHIESGAVLDSSGNAFEGSDFKFSTLLLDTAAPRLSQLLPKNNAKDVAVDTDLKLTFNETLQFGSGEIEINNGAVSTKISVSDSTQITLTKNVLLINPAADFELGNNYVVTLPKGILQDKAGNAQAATSFNFNTLDAISTGTAIDGYLSGATVFADTNGNGVWDTGEAKTITDNKGDFKLTNAKGTIIASGGTDLTSGKAFTGTLKAPAGSKVVTPLTTVQQGFVESGQTAAEAQKSVAKAFGFSETINLKTYDPIKVLENATTATDKQAATDLMASTVKIANFLITGGQVLTGSSGNDEIYGSYGSGNVLSGGAGNDYIFSNGNNATLTGGSGNDYFGINSGTALITDFSNAEGDRIYVVGGTMTVPITVSTDFSNSTDFNFGTLRISAAAATAAVSVTGSNGDSITGSVFSDSITGSNGADTITGGVGADTLDGGYDRDTYIISATGQTANAPTGWTALGVSMAGGSTIDTTGMDIISMSARDMLDLTAIAPTLTFVTATTTTIIDATSFIAAGTGTAAQLFKGAYANNTFTSSESGMDTLLVYDNNGSIEGGTLEAVVLQGITTLAAYDGIITAPDSTPPQGGLGLDTVNNVTVYSTERGTAYLYPTGTTVNPILTTALMANTNVVLNIAPQLTAGIFDVVVKDIAGNAKTITTNVILGTTGDDSLTGTSYDDVISGFAGNDTISGGAGFNTLIGGTGNDVFNVDVDGYDSIIDFTSGEMLNISANAKAYIYLPSTGGTFDYSNGTNNGSLYIYGNYDWNDNTISASETITGSSGNDDIRGSYGSGNVLSGGAGNDDISSNGNNDTLTGGAGSDLFRINSDPTPLITDFSSAEGDRLYVGEGTTATVPITASTDFSTLVDNYGTLKISAAAATAAVSITGTNGLDIITGSSGADTLNGGNGLDTYIISATGQTGSAPAAWTATTDLIVGGSTIDTTSMDIISMLVMEGDKLDISAIASTLTSVTTTTTTIIDATSFTAAGTGTAAQSFKGAYANNTFTSSESGMVLPTV